MYNEIKKSAGEAIVALCSPQTLSQFGNACDADVKLHAGSGDIFHGVPKYIEILNKVHEHLDGFDRQILSAVCEPDDDGHQIVFHSKNHVKPKGAEEMVFDDFTLVHVNKEGKIDKLWQGPGAYQHIYPFVNA
jgi:hypothetical protein